MGGTELDERTKRKTYEMSLIKWPMPTLPFATTEKAYCTERRIKIKIHENETHSSFFQALLQEFYVEEWANAMKEIETQSTFTIVETEQ